MKVEVEKAKYAGLSVWDYTIRRERIIYEWRMKKTHGIDWVTPVNKSWKLTSETGLLYSSELTEST